MPSGAQARSAKFADSAGATQRKKQTPRDNWQMAQFVFQPLFSLLSPVQSSEGFQIFLNGNSAKESYS
jgi:hypothetical protein